MQFRLIVASCVSYTESILLQKSIGIRDKKKLISLHTFSETVILNGQNDLYHTTKALFL